MGGSGSKTSKFSNASEIPVRQSVGQSSLAGDIGGFSMRNRNLLVKVAVAVTMVGLFAVMFWSQVGGIATAFARSKAGTYAFTSSPYIQRLQPIY
jgi:hypothetical protein